LNASPCSSSAASGRTATASPVSARRSRRSKPTAASSESRLPIVAAGMPGDPIGNWRFNRPISRWSDCKNFWPTPGWLRAAPQSG
jgi:hypothetical protein